MPVILWPHSLLVTQWVSWFVIDRSFLLGWHSCPSYGWSSGVDRLWGLPNGEPLVVALAAIDRPAYSFPMEAHGPYIGLGTRCMHSNIHIRCFARDKLCMVPKQSSSPVMHDACEDSTLTGHHTEPCAT